MFYILFAGKASSITLLVVYSCIPKEGLCCECRDAPRRASTENIARLLIPTMAPTCAIIARRHQTESTNISPHVLRRMRVE